MQRIYLLLLPLLAIGLASCEDDLLGSGGSDIDPGLVMTVNGTDWIADGNAFNDPIAPQGNHIKELLAFRGLINSDESIVITFVDLDPGSYDIEPTSQTASLLYVADSDPGSGFTADDVTASTGKLTVVENTADSIAGRFEFSGTSTSGTIYNVTDGAFRVKK